MAAVLRKGYVETADGQVHYWTAGRGPALVCLHQASQDSSEYRALIGPLAAACTLVAFDLPGHGQSFDPPRAYDIPDYVRVLGQAMDALALSRCAVLGHHSGAVLALELAAREPQRIAKAVFSGLSWRSPENTQELIAARARRHLPVTLDGEFLVRMWQTYAGLGGEGTPLEAVLEPYLVNQMMRLRPYDAHHAVLAWDKTPALAAVRCPVLLVQGERDVFVTGQGRLMAALPQARHVVIPGAGAFTFRDRPGETARILQEFLAAEGPGMA